MVVVAQLVRALVCGTRGRGFESHLPPLKPMQKHRLFCCSKVASPSLSNVVIWTLRAQSQYLSLPCNSCNSSLRHQELFFAASVTFHCIAASGTLLCGFSNFSLHCGFRNSSLQLQQFAVCSLLPQKYLWAVLLPTVQQNCSVVGIVLFQKAISQGVLPTTKCRKISHTHQEYSHHESQEDAA